MENQQKLVQIYIRHKSCRTRGEFTDDIENVWVVIMVDCPYLDFKASSCRGCSGFFCTAKGRRKKLSDTSMCRDEREWVECPRYLGTLGAAERALLTTPEEHKAHVAAARASVRCPYRGPRPDGQCCGEHCYAVGAYLKLPHKTCKSGWLDCGRYWEGFDKKMKFYGDE